MTPSYYPGGKELTDKEYSKWMDSVIDKYRKRKKIKTLQQVKEGLKKKTPKRGKNERAN
jgi:hypothetical protein